MEFCSEYGYNYGFNGSDEDSYSSEDESTKQRVKRKIRKADTNIIAVKFDELVNVNETFAGEPISCKQCGGILSAFSKNNIENFVWKCEYCAALNDLKGKLDDIEQIPKKGDVTYIIEVAKKKEETAKKDDGKKSESTDDAYLTFCIDVSGSMDTMIPIKPPTTVNPVDADTQSPLPSSPPPPALPVAHRIQRMSPPGGVHAGQRIVPLGPPQRQRSQSPHLVQQPQPILSSTDDLLNNQMQTAYPIPPMIQQQYIQPPPMMYGVQQMSYIQRIPNRFDDSNSISRLAGVKIACIETLKSMKDDTPKKRVAVVTFSDSVKYFGDCKNVQNHTPLLTINSYRQQASYMSTPSRRTATRSGGITRQFKNLFASSSKSPNRSASPGEDEQEAVESVNDLENKERLLTHAANTNGDLDCIRNTHSSIEQRIKFLHTEGSTALGPALLFSVGFSAKKSGSSVILCTDGAANVGIGSVESNPEASAEFYDEVADYAKQNGVTVNVISMEGTDCKLALLGRVAERSSGTLSIVNPANLGDEFKSILGNRVVAVNVMAKLIVNHKYLYIRDSKLETEETKAIDKNDKSAKQALDAKKQSVTTRDIGNANIDTEITYEYGFRKISNEKPENVKELPFQVQITYTTSDGTKAMRVYTKEQKFTRSRVEAEQKILSRDLIFSNAAQMMSNQVLSENVSASKYRNQANENLLLRNNFASPQAYAQTSSMVKQISKSQKVSDMADFEAANFYNQAKVSRSKMAK